MIINCRKIRDHRFIFFGENGPDRNMPPVGSESPRNMEAPEQKDAKENIGKNGDQEEVAKMRESIEARHQKIGIRIDNAKAKYEKCMNIAKKLPEGSPVRNTAEEACGKAKDKLVRIDRIFPKAIDPNLGSKPEVKPEVAAEPAPTDAQKLDTVLDKSSSQTGTVIKELSDIQKTELAAKKVVDSFKGLGIDAKVIQAVFIDYPEPADTESVLRNFQKLNVSGKEDSFKKVVDSINANGDMNQVLENLADLNAIKLSPSQEVTILSLHDVAAGSLKIEEIVKYLKTASGNKFDTDFAISVIDKVDLKKEVGPQLEKLQYFVALQEKAKTLGKVLDDNTLDALYAAKKSEAAQGKNFDSDFAISVIDKVDLKKEVAPQLEKIQYFIKLQEACGPEITEKTMGDLYDKEKNPATVIAFLANVKDLSPNMVDKIALFLVESDPIKAREVFASVKDKADVKGSLEEKELADYKSKYPDITKVELSFLDYSPDNPNSNENALRFGRLIDNNPGLYAFMENEMSRVENNDPKQGEFENFAKDPSLPLAYKIYIKLGGPIFGKTTFGIGKMEDCLNLARTLHEHGVKPSALDNMSKEQIEAEFEKQNDLSKQKGDINLYTYPATDESGNVIKNRDGSVKMLNREFVLVANYENNATLTQGSSTQPHFWSDKLFRDLAISGAKFEGQKFNKDGSPMLDDKGQLVWENPVKKLDENGKPMTDEKGNPIFENKGTPKNVFTITDCQKFKEEKAEKNIAEIVLLKENILNRIRNAQPPMTTCFNGHGGTGSGLVLADTDFKRPDGTTFRHPAGSISAKELADAIKFRSDKFKNNSNLSKDIYLISACASHEFVQDVLKKIKEDQSVQPIISGATGHGMNLVDTGATGANFVMGKPNATVRDLLVANSAKNTGNHGYTYVPNDQGRAAQITRHYGPAVAKAPAQAPKPS